VLHKDWSGGTQRTLMGLDAITIISNSSIDVPQYAVYQDLDTIDDMLAKLKGNVAALIAANH